MACPQCHSVLQQQYYEIDNERNDLIILWTCPNCKIELQIYYPANHAHIKKINKQPARITMQQFTEDNRKKHLKLGIVHEFNMSEHVKEETEKATEEVPRGYLGLF
ncbi:MAG TPA: hypothetical protein VL854_03345 [Nitrososphaeraceae archaeon]|nr:hypothetical protein [Nitrososphaeraceae archaeon]